MKTETPDRDRLLASLLANMPGTLFYRILLKPDGHLSFDYVSPNVEQVLGVTAEAALRDARLLYERIQPEDQPAWRARVQQSAITGESLEYTARVRVADGSIRWFQLRSHLVERLPDGTQLRDGVASDIHALKEAEALLRSQADNTTALRHAQALEQSEQRLKEAQAIAHVGHWEWDVRTRKRVWSDEIYRIYGLEPQSIDITDEYFFGHIHPSDRDSIVADTPPALARPRPATRTYRIVRDDGTVRHLRDEEVPAVDDAGQLTHYRGTSQDITAAKEVEETLRAHERQLTRQLRHLDALARINRCSLLAQTTEELLDSVLEQILDIFGADRAWFLHPCDPEAESWGVPMERTRPKWPGAFATRQRLPMIPEIAAVFREHLAATQPIPYGPGFPHQVPPSTAAQFSIRSQLLVCLRPKVGAAWLFGLHHCEEARRYDEEEQRLFADIAQRISDSLGSLTAQEGLRDSEERFRGLFTYGPMPVILATLPDCRIVDLNPAALALFNCERKEVVGHTTPELGFWHNPEDRLRMVAGLEATGCVSGMETTLCGKDGRPFAALLNARSIRLHDQPHSLITVTDITERLQAMATLRESEERFHGLFDHSPVPMVVASFPGGRILDFNAALTAVYGYTREQSVGRTTGELNFWLNPADRQRFLQILQQSGFVNGFEADMRRSNGETAPTLLHCQIINYDGHRCSLVTMIDISAQRDALAQLRRTELQFQELFEFAPDATVMVDQRGRIIRVNQRAEQLFGYQRHELLGQSIEMLVPEAKREAHAHARNVYAERAAPRAMGERSAPLFARRKDGSIFPAEISLGPIKSAQGLVVAAAIRDATPMIEAEKQRRESETRMRQAQKMESLGTLAGGIAHDFNNILTGLLGFVELARHDLSPAHPSRHWLDNIALSGARAKELVRQILTFSHKHESDRAPLRLQGVIREALGLLRSTLPPMVTIEEHVDTACPPVLADSTQIHQVIMNLCTNAWHALPESGGCITLGLESCNFATRQQVGHRMMESGPLVRLIVQDNGCGMEPAVLERIFEPFFTTKPTGQGTGLGLAVVHGIIESHDGAVSVRSTAGQGTTFELYFPALSATAAPAPPAHDTLPRGRGQRVLLVDDDPAAGAALSGVVRLLGYQVAYHQNPSAALAHYLENPEAHDLLLTDFAMPGLPGLKLAQAARERRPGLPVILISGYIDPRRTQELHGAGIREVLSKPPAREELASALARCLPR